MFGITLARVLIMLAYAVPGFIFIKIKAIKPESISAFAKLLAYVCGPCLAFYSFSRAEYSPQLNKMILIAFAAALGITFCVMGAAHLLLRKKYADIRWRIFTVALVCGNVGFFGIPLLEQLLPDYPNAFVFSEVMSLSMNLAAWTYGLYIISLDKKYIRIHKIFTVPHFIALSIAYPMFLLGWSFPAPVTDAIVQMGRMSTPLCMIILGMRLATVPFRELIGDWRALTSALLKMTLYPLIYLGVTALLPLDPYVRAALFALACCPCASMILNLSEIRGMGQKSAANTVLIATLICVLVIPVMITLFFPL